MAKGKASRDASIDDLARSLAAGELKPVYVLIGEEAFLRHRGRQLIHETVVGKLGGSVAIFTSDDPLEKILEELRGDSLFAARRMVEIVQADKLLREKADALARYLERPSASGVLVIDAMKLDGRTRLPGIIRSAGMLINCPTIYENRVGEWVRSEAGRRGVRMSSAAVSVLVDEVGNNLFALSGELDKLLAYAGEKKTIDAEDVGRLTGHLRSWVVWALTDALGRRDAAEALRVLPSLLEEDARGIGVVGTLNWQVSRLSQGKYLLEAGGQRDDLIRKLRVPPMQAQALVEQIARFSKQDLARLSKMLLDVDIALKTSAGETTMVLEKFLVEACGTK